MKNKTGNLNKLRQNIQKNDREILILLTKRFRIVKRIIKFKKQNNIDIKNSNYELFLKNKYSYFLKDKESKNLLIEIIQSIFDISKKYQKLLSSRDEK
ncbi:MAG: chorismate mutase [Candidatus Muirbacterium halophilum]|nr:chorismate mutase [Candidatus Muirbacterium halophilum]MCK9476847.1 chorismate mutase [Candidatus Muirbacterium halophilum]